MTVTILPWSLKGISDDAREYAKRASGDAGIPVGTWLSAVIRAAAEADGITPGALPEADAGLAADLIPDLVAAPMPGRGPGGGNTIERAVQYVASFGNEPEGPVRDEDLIEDPEFLQTEIEALERRLSESESRTNEALSPLVAEIERLRARLDRLRTE